MKLRKQQLVTNCSRLEPHDVFVNCSRVEPTCSNVSVNCSQSYAYNKQSRSVRKLCEQLHEQQTKGQPSRTPSWRLPAFTNSFSKTVSLQEREGCVMTVSQLSHYLREVHEICIVTLSRYFCKVRENSVATSSLTCLHAPLASSLQPLFAKYRSWTNYYPWNSVMGNEFLISVLHFKKFMKLVKLHYALYAQAPGMCVHMFT